MSLSRIALSSGRSIELSELRLTSTYGGFLEGYPCKPINNLKISGLLETAERTFPTTPVHLVPPVREYPDGTAGAFGPIEVLPPVACIGAFHSTPIDPEHDSALYRSVLAVVWFQSTPDVPSGDGADAALRGIHWEELAQDDEL